MRREKVLLRLGKNSPQHLKLASPVTLLSCRPCINVCKRLPIHLLYCVVLIFHVDSGREVKKMREVLWALSNVLLVTFSTKTHGLEKTPFPE